MIGQRNGRQAQKKAQNNGVKYNNKVLIRIGNGGKRSNPKRRFVVDGTILKKRKHSDN